MEKLDLSSYQPDWRGDEHSKDECDEEHGYFWNEEALKQVKPNDPVDPENEVYGRHIVTAMNYLKETLFHSGPYSEDEFLDAVRIAVAEEALNNLLAMGLIQQNGDTYSLTELGQKEVESMKDRLERL